jgi:hypothetical protein
MNTLNGHSVDSPDAMVGVGWGAIIAGALAILGLMLILTPLGAALGFAFSSPWNHEGGFGKALTVGSAVWLIIVQWISSGFGGYLTGRLRSQWPGAHTHEVYFRDTAQGFLAWALASVFGAIVLVSVAAHVGPHPMPHDMPAMSDSLFRNPTFTAVNDADRAEAQRILAHGIAQGQIPEDDKNYLVELIATRTGMSPADANTRVDTVFAQEKTAVKAAGKASFLLCLSLLMGALISAIAGALGGLHRDVHYEHGKLRL